MTELIKNKTYWVNLYTIKFNLWVRCQYCGQDEEGLYWFKNADTKSIHTNKLECIKPENFITCNTDYYYE